MLLRPTCTAGPIQSLREPRFFSGLMLRTICPRGWLVDRLAIYHGQYIMYPSKATQNFKHVCAFHLAQESRRLYGTSACIQNVEPCIFNVPPNRAVCAVELQSDRVYIVRFSHDLMTHGNMPQTFQVSEVEGRVALMRFVRRANV